MGNRFGFDRVLSRSKSEQIVLAKQIANGLKNYYLDSFQKQSWEGKTWKQVNRRIPGTYEYKYPKKRGLTRRTKPILIGKGILRRGVVNSIKSATPRSIKFVVDLPYAKRHNEGLDNMPKRQYMGFNSETDKIARDLISKAMSNILNK